MKYLLDTTVLVDIFRGKNKLEDWKEALKGKLSISSISACELLQGARDKEEMDKIKSFLELVEVIEVNVAMSKMSKEFLFEYSLDQGLHVLDALIAAVALQEKLRLVTDNVRHFEFIKGLDVKRASELLG